MPPRHPNPRQALVTREENKGRDAVGGRRMRRKGGRVHLSPLEKDNSTASIKLIN